MVWLPDGEKRIHERDGRTDAHKDTTWRHRLRLHSIAPQKCNTNQKWSKLKLTQEVRFVELGVCPMQLFHF